MPCESLHAYPVSGGRAMKHVLVVFILMLAVPGLDASETVFLSASGDTHVWQFGPNINYGNSDNITVGYLYGWSNALIKFDLCSFRYHNHRCNPLPVLLEPDWQRPGTGYLHQQERFRLG